MRSSWILILAIGFTLIACGDDDDDAQPADEPTLDESDAATVGENGTAEVTQAADANPDDLIGAWVSTASGDTLEFHDDGTWLAEGQTGPQEFGKIGAGVYSASAIELTFGVDEPGSFGAGAPTDGCSQPDSQGTYGWTIEEDVLTLEVVDEDCSARHAHLRADNRFSRRD